MKNNYFILVLVFLMSCSSSSVPSFEEAKKMIKAQNEKLHQIVKTKNTELLREVYADDAKWLAPDLQIVIGKDSIIAKWKQSLPFMEDMNSSTLFWGGEGKCIYEVGEVETKIRLQNPDTTFFYKAKYNNVWTLQKDGTYRLSVDIWNDVKE